MKKALLIPFIVMTTQLMAQPKNLPAKNDSPKSMTTQKGDVKDNYFGQEIKDPYRWLEDDNSPATAAWVKDQNQITNTYLNTIPFRGQVNKELSAMWNYVKYSNPSKEGDYYLYYKNDGLQNQSVLYIQKGLGGNPQEFINPNTMNTAGTSSLGSVVFSRNQKYCAYSVSNAGSDWQDIYVMDVASKSKLKDVIHYSKFSNIAWKGDEGFYYSGYDKPLEKNKFSAKTEFQKIFFHAIGNDPAKDELIYEDKEHPLMYKGADLTDDERWLILNLSEGTSGNELRFIELDGSGNKDFKMLCKGFETDQEVIGNLGDHFLIYTNYGAPNYRLMLASSQNPDPANWEIIIPEKENKLDGVHRVGNKLFCSYLVNACSQTDVYSVKGNFESTITLPGLGTVSGFAGSSKDDETFYTYTSYNVPPTIYRYNVNEGTSELFKSPAMSTDVSNTVVNQVWFTSKDGTKVPMFIYHRADFDVADRPRPVLMYGYGGFDISLTPSFSIPMSYFVQKGGIYVSVSLRGGSEFGEKWHEGGMLANKQNVFDDFIGAAEFLISNGITRNDMLAIHGRSNGGLLVGACMTQRPDLFKVALPGVGVLDMLRYHKFTVGWGWAVEYGSSDKEEDFKYLIKYSPLHNITKDNKYPATMITTGDHDDRVVPAHSFKFAATLQEANASPNPILIRIDTQAGHGAGKPTSKQIDEWTDMLSFTMYHLGMNPNK